LTNLIQYYNVASMSELQPPGSGKTPERLEVERQIKDRLRTSKGWQRAGVGLGLLFGISAGVLHAEAEVPQVIPSSLIVGMVAVTAGRFIERRRANNFCGHLVVSYAVNNSVLRGTDLSLNDHVDSIMDSMLTRTTLIPDGKGGFIADKHFDQDALGSRRTFIDTVAPFAAGIGTLMVCDAITSETLQSAALPVGVIGGTIAGSAILLSEINSTTRDDVAAYNQRLDNIDGRGFDMGPFPE